MEFTCLGTGSSGNCYLLNVGSSNILLDAGVRPTNIVKACNLNKIDFAFVSHEHKDHSLSLNFLVSRGVKVVDGSLFNAFIKNKYSDKITYYTFPVEHGDCNCCGIIIQSKDECILYVTDFTVCKFNFSSIKFTSVIVECNYIAEKVTKDNNFIRTKENIYRHLSLEGCDLFLSKLNLSKCKEIILTHFSDNFSDPIYMGSYINQKYKIKTLCCKRFGGYDIYE